MPVKGNVRVDRDPFDRESETYWIVGPPAPVCQHVKSAYGGREYPCRWTIAQHRDLPESVGHEFDGGPSDPAPWDYVPALVHTEWTCPYCGVENDVWGEGAINSWMECECGREMWLSFDMYLSGDERQPPSAPVWGVDTASGQPS